MSASATLLLLLLGAQAAAAQDRTPPAPRVPYPPAMTGASAEVYKKAGGVELNIWVFNPAGSAGGARRPAIVFFFGGGWIQGSPQQFYEQCRYLASRGMVAMAADYRVGSRHGVKIAECVSDAKSAIRWVRANAERLGVDPRRIAAAGGSAGGHLAAATGILREFDDPAEQLAISSRPDALVLFNPALVLAPLEGLPEISAVDLRARAGVESVRVSPHHHIAKGVPPTIIFHGKADTTVPYRSVELFTQAMTAAGNRCELRGYEGASHGFFNFGRGDNSSFIDTVRRMDLFLGSLGFVTGSPSVEGFAWAARQ